MDDRFFLADETLDLSCLELNLTAPRSLRYGNRAMQANPALQGRRTGSRRRLPAEDYHPLDFGQTVNAALTRLALLKHSPPERLLSEQDLHKQIRSQPPRRLLVFAIDTSDSMGDGPEARMSAALGAIISLAATAYLNRDQVCLITFRGKTAEVIVPPTDSVTRIRQQVDRLPVGGATPLAAGLQKTLQVISQARLKNQSLMPLLVLISDGVATIPLQPGAEPNQEALEIAHRLYQDRVPALVIDTLPGHYQRGLMPQLAAAMGTHCEHIHNLQTNQVLTLIENRKPKRPL